jgi:lipid-A-disaccharide synthase
MPKRVFFSVGEPSGDLHGSNLIGRLKELDPSIECVGFGGPKMQAAGCDLLFDLTTKAVMFFWDAIKQYRSFLRLVDQAADFFAANEIEAVVLIDYPGFNWHIAKKAKRRGIPVFYYGVPQMWAWAPWRVRKLRRSVDHVLCKLPFEVDWFARRDVRATYVGHPYFDQIASQTYDEDFSRSLTDGDRPLVTLLPGSRDKEVVHHLPILLDAADQVLEQVPTARVAIAFFSEAQQQSSSEQLSEHHSGIESHVQRTPELMRASNVCLACSGSVSLELLHYRKPTVIVYKVAKWMMVAQAFVLRTQFITLTNLIAAKDICKRTWGPYDPDAPGDIEPAVMPEYVTTGNPAAKVAAKAVEWLQDPAERQKTVDRLDELARQYARPGATDRAAEFILQQLAMDLHATQSNK